MTTPTVTPARPGEPGTAPAPPPAAPATPPAETVTVREPATDPAKPATATDPAAPSSADQLEAARRQEGDALFKRLETTGDAERQALLAELVTLRKEREDRAAEAAAQKAAAEEAAKTKRESDMSAKALLEQRTQEWETRFAQMQTERERERETLAKESEFNRLRAYAQERVGAERDNIAPELLDLVSGNSQEEIDASVEMMKAKTAQILQSVQQAQVAARSQMRGVSATGFTSQGPADNAGGELQLSVEDIKNMPMATYAKYREQLLGAASQAHRQRGLFG